MLKQQQSPLPILSQAHQFLQAGASGRLRRFCELVDTYPLRNARTLHEPQGFQLLKRDSDLGLVIANQSRDLGGGTQTGCVTVQKSQSVPFADQRYAESLEVLKNLNIMGFFGRQVKSSLVC